MPTFGFILADSGIFRALGQLDIFMYIKAYSEPIADSGIFRAVAMFSQFQIPVDAQRRFNVCKTSIRHIQDPGIPVQVMHSNACSLSQVLLLNRCSDLFGTFFHFYFKSKHSTCFSSG